jgi:hypothetical protein
VEIKRLITSRIEVFLSIVNKRFILLVAGL